LKFDFYVFKYCKRYFVSKYEIENIWCHSKINNNNNKWILKIYFFPKIHLSNVVCYDIELCKENIFKKVQTSRNNERGHL